MHPPAEDNYGNDACVYPASTIHVWFVYWYLRPVKLSVQGPLLMHPPAEDNNGNDACSILRLPSMFDLYTDISDQWS